VTAAPRRSSAEQTAAARTGHAENQTRGEIVSETWRRGTRAIVGAARAGGLVALAGACAAGADPQLYAERALREDAREAAAYATAPGADDRLRIDTGAVSRALGSAGRLHGEVFAVRLPGGGAVAFHPAGGGRAALTGDVVLPAGAVAGAVRALAAHGIAVTNVSADSPAADAVAGHPESRVLHVWAVDDAARVAEELRAALDTAP
jgi:hypothetical protein